MTDPRSETMDKLNTSILYNDIANNLGCPSVPLNIISGFHDNVLTINTSQDFNFNGKNILDSFVYPMEGLQYLVLDDSLIVKDELDNPVDFSPWLTFNAPATSGHSSTTLTMDERQNLFGKLTINIDSTNNSLIPVGDYSASINYSVLPTPQGSILQLGVLRFAISVESDTTSLNTLLKTCPGLSDFTILSSSGESVFNISKIFDSGIISDNLYLDLTESDKSILFDIIDGSRGDIIDERKIRTIINFTPPSILSSDIKKYIDTNYAKIHKLHIQKGFSFATEYSAKSSYPLRIDRSKVFKLLVNKLNESMDDYDYIINISGDLYLRDFLDSKLGIPLSKTVPLTSDAFILGIDYTHLKSKYMFARSLSNMLSIRGSRIDNINAYYKNKFNIDLRLTLDEDGKLSVQKAVETLYENIKNINFDTFYLNKVISHDINRIYSNSFSVYQDGYASSISSHLKYLNEFNSSLTSSNITDAKYNKTYRTPTLSLNYHKLFSEHYALMTNNKDYFLASTLRDLIDYLTIDNKSDNSYKVDRFSLLFNYNNYFNYNYLGVDSDGLNAHQYILNHNLSSTTISELRQKLTDLNIDFLDPLSSNYKQFYIYNNLVSENQLKAFLHKIVKKYNPLLNISSATGKRNYNGLNYYHNSLVRSLNSIFLYKSPFEYFLPIVGSSDYDDYGHDITSMQTNQTILPQVKQSVDFYTGLSAKAQCYNDYDGWFDWRDYCGRLKLDSEYIFKYYSLNSYLNYFPPIDGSRRPSKYANTENFIYKSFSIFSKYFPGFHPFMISSETGFISRSIPSLLPDLMKTTMYKNAFARFLIHQAANELSDMPVIYINDYRTFVLDIID